MSTMIPQLIDAYYKGKLTSHDAIVGILMCLKPSDTNASFLESLGSELGSAFETFVSDYRPEQRSTGDVPTDEQIGLARDWIATTNKL